jgi:hypothetical protein
LGYLGSVNFNAWELASFINLAVSSNTESISISEEYELVTIRPEILKVGMLAEFS